MPAIPDNAPFTPEQRAYLNGFLAGLFSRASVAPPPLAATQPTARTLRPLTILFASQTGNAEALAKRAAKAAAQKDFAPTVCDVAQYERASLTQEQSILFIASTYGSGDPPDAAKPFWKHLNSDSAPLLSGVRFSVCALGDSNYEKFCEFGKGLDLRLADLRATRVFPRVDCDADFEAGFSSWLGSVLAAFGEPSHAQAVPASPGPIRSAEPASASPVYSRQNPFRARLVANRILNGPGSCKETRHFEIDLEGSGLAYEAGDALGIMPVNCPELVSALIRALGSDPSTAVPIPGGGEAPLEEALSRYYEITRISKPLLQCIAERTKEERLLFLASPQVNGELEKFLRGRDILDLLLGHPRAEISPREFVALLRNLAPRAYSISSSPKAHGSHVHLTVGIVRYESLGRPRKGVCSTFLAERAAEGTVSTFVQPNKGFRPPSDGARPMIMVGPGTGIAPFRAFLHERRATGAKGRNWLFFGDQRSSTDFLYREELADLQAEGTLTRLETAFSRDQSQKIYVQDRMLEHAGELHAWLEQGAHFYVCGDASRMAADVEKTLHKVIEQAGGKTPEQAAEYVEGLRAERRYQRDVY